VSFDALTLFGLFAITAMLIFYELEDRSPGSFSHSPGRAPSVRSVASCRERPFGLIEAVLDLHSGSPLVGTKKPRPK